MKSRSNKVFNPGDIVRFKGKDKTTYKIDKLGFGLFSQDYLYHLISDAGIEKDKIRADELMLVKKDKSVNEEYYKNYREFLKAQGEIEWNKWFNLATGRNFI